MELLYRRATDRFLEIPAPRQRWLVTAGFLLVQLLLWTFVLQVLWYRDRSITDVPVYYDYAARIAGGMLPYRDFASEYPPVAMLLFSLPRLLSGSGYGAFAFWFEAEMLAFSCGNVLLISMLAWRRWGTARQVAGALGLYTFFILALGAIVTLRFDLAAAFIILAAAVCYITDRRLAAWVLLGVGLMTKVVPLLVAPLFLALHWRRRQYTWLLWGPVAALATAALIALPFLVASPSGLAGAFLYHAERPLQIESSWASPLLVLHSLGLISADIMNSYGSHNVFSPGSGTAALISGPVTALVLLAGYAMFWRKSAICRAAASSGTPEAVREGSLSGPCLQDLLIRYAALAVGIFIVGGKVLSPQFLIWLLPLLPLVAGRDRRLVLGLFTAVLLLTQWEFPTHYWSLYTLNTHMVVTVAIRNLVLAAMVVALAIGGWRASPLAR